MYDNSGFDVHVLCYSCQLTLSIADPDKVPEAEREEAEKKFKQLTAGNNILSDPTKRQRFDAGPILPLQNIYLWLIPAIARAS